MGKCRQAQRAGAARRQALKELRLTLLRGRDVSLENVTVLCHLVLFPPSFPSRPQVHGASTACGPTVLSRIRKIQSTLSKQRLCDLKETSPLTTLLFHK